jgi:hypothetical protein
LAPQGAHRYEHSNGEFGQRGILRGVNRTGDFGAASEEWPLARQPARAGRFVLANKYLEVRNKSTYPAQPKNPKGEVHEGWGMISYDRSRKRLVLRQFHAEGFVNQYAAEPHRGGVLSFSSESIENIPAGFRARESYTIMGPNEFVERFEIAEPGKEFELYSETHFRRRDAKAGAAP